MKTYQTVLIGGLMAFGLAACSSTGTGAGAGTDGSNNATNTAAPATPPVLDGASPPPNVPTGAAGNGVSGGGQ